MENTEVLQACPFCGNAVFDRSNMQSVAVKETERKTVGYGIPADRPFMVFYVECGKCYARAGVGVSGRNGITKTTITEAQARQLAVEKWNRRA